MVKSAMLEAFEIIENKFSLDSTEVKICGVVAHNSTRIGTGYSPAKPTDDYRFTLIKEKGKGPSLKKRKIQPIPPICIKCSNFGANVGKRGMCSICYKQS